ncbi:MAG: CHAT domain-containing protein [Planctomycetaceae bacterium]
MQKEDLRKAEQMLQQAAELARPLGIAHSEVLKTAMPLGRCHLLNGDYDLAIARFGPLLYYYRQLNIITADVEMYIVECYLEKGDLGYAILFAEAAAESCGRSYQNTHPLSLETLVLRARVLHKVGRVAEARADIRDVVSMIPGLSPDNVQARMRIQLAVGEFFTSDDAADLAAAQFEAVRTLLNSRPLPLTRARLACGFGSVLLARGKAGQAIPIFQAALKDAVLQLGDSHPAVVKLKLGLAAARAERGEKTAAVELIQSCQQIQTQRLGASHPSVIRLSRQLAQLSDQSGQTATAMQHLQDARQRGRMFLTTVLPTLSRQEQLTAIAELQANDDLLYAVQHVAQPGVAEMSAEWIINGKAAATGAMATQAVILRDADGDDQRQRVYALSQLRTEIARLATLQQSAAPLPSRELLELRIQELRLWRDIVLRHRFPKQPWITLDSLRKALPRDSVYVDIVRMTGNSSAPPWTEDRYVAWIMPPEGSGRVTVVDLGSAARLDAEVVRVRTALETSLQDLPSIGAEEAVKEVNQECRVLETMFREKLLPGMTGYRQILISPDSQLWLLPFCALHLDDETYIIERFVVRYVTSGRDLVINETKPEISNPTLNALLNDPEFAAFVNDESLSQLKATLKGEGNPAVIFADPDFDAEPGLPVPGRADRGVSGASTSLRNSILQNNAQRLTFSAAEAAVVSPLLTSATGLRCTVHQQAQATEDAFKALKSPSVLLVSSHGFFFPANRTSPFSLILCCAAVCYWRAAIGHLLRAVKTAF